MQRHLRHKRHTRHSKNTIEHQEPQINYLSFHDRPEFINNRKHIDDWEIDTVMGKQDILFF